MGMVAYLRRASAADIQRLRDEPGTAERFVFQEGDQDRDLVDFDKAWQGLHFLLVGESYGSGKDLGIIADETPFEGNSESGGFSVVDPDRMSRFAVALRAVDDATLKQRFDPQAMVAADIYLADVFADDGDFALDYIMQGVPALRAFADSCAAAGDGAVRVIA